MSEFCLNFLRMSFLTIRVQIRAGQGLTATLLMVLVGLWLSAGDSSGAHTSVPDEANSRQVWNFDTDSAGGLPKNFVVGMLVDSRPAGGWKVIDMKKFPSFLHGLNRRERTRITKVLQTNGPPSPPHVFAQLKNKGFEHDYPVVLIEETTAADLDLEVAFLPVAGKGDMGGGLVWHAQDHQNYYITRANPLEQNIRFYRVVKGVRHKLANFDQIISVKKWHTLRVVVRDNHFQIIYDGQSVLDVRDDTFKAGRIGLWTKADAVTYFDNLQLSIVK